MTIGKESNLGCVFSRLVGDEFNVQFYSIDGHIIKDHFGQKRDIAVNNRYLESIWRTIKKGHEFFLKKSE